MAKIVNKCPECGKVAKAIKTTDSLFLGRMVDLECGHVLFAGEIIAQDIPIGRDAFWMEARPYQQEAVEFIEKSNFVCLNADEMGLGKTIETLLAIRYSKEKLTPILFIVKSALKYQWAAEIIKWLAPEPKLKDFPNNENAVDTNGTAPNIKDVPFIVHDGKSVIIPGFSYYILSMSVLIKHLPELMELKPRLLVIDESHHFKTSTSNRTKALSVLAPGIPHKVCLSGTPVLNRASEYFTTLNLLHPEDWYSKESFERQWIQFYQKPGSRVPQPGGIKQWKRDEFFSKTRPYILRREKKDVLKDLPEFSRNFRIVGIEDPQYKLAYNRQAQALRNYMDTMSKDSAFERSSNLLAYLTRMRQITGVAKVPLVIEDAKEFLELTGHKLCIGIHHKIVAKLLKEGLSDYNPIPLSGEDNDEQRFEKVRDFEKSENLLMIASTLAGGEGLNLQFCDSCIMVERQWNTAKEVQFEGRFHRYGQKNPVSADYYLAKGTIDEWFTQLVLEKKQYTDSAMKEGADIEEVNFVSVPLEDLAEMSTRLL